MWSLSAWPTPFCFPPFGPIVAPSSGWMLYYLCFTPLTASWTPLCDRECDWEALSRIEGEEEKEEDVGKRQFRRRKSRYNGNEHEMRIHKKWTTWMRTTKRKKKQKKEERKMTNDKWKWEEKETYNQEKDKTLGEKTTTIRGWQWLEK